MSAEIGPRLDPFPWEDWFQVFPAGSGYAQDFAQISAFINRSENVATELHVNIVGASWEHPNVVYGPGLNTPANLYNPDINVPCISLNAGAGPDVLWGYDADATNPTVRANHITTDYKDYYDPAILAGHRVYHGVFSASPWSGAGYLHFPWLNQPVLFETWFETNSERPDPDYGYSGYTKFDDDSGSYLNVSYGNTASVPADIYRRRYVHGIVKRTANFATLGPADVMQGAIITSDGTTTTMQACYNGVVVGSFTRPTPKGYAAYPALSFDSVCEVAMESAWSGPLADMQVPVGTTAWYEVYPLDGGTDGIQMTMHPLGSNPGPEDVRVYGYDTYDIKFGYYIDDYSPTHPVGTTTYATSHLSYDAGVPNTYTHPHWPLPPPPVYDFWTEFDEAREVGAPLPVPPPPPGAFRANALALNPIFYIDFTGPLGAEDTPIDVAVDNYAGTHNPILWYGGTSFAPESQIVQGPLGDAYYDSSGGWWGAWCDPFDADGALFYNLLANGFTMSKVMSAISETGEYTALNFSIDLSGFTWPVPAGEYVQSIIFDLEGDAAAQFSSTGSTRLLIQWMLSDGTTGSYANERNPVVSVPTPFFETADYFVFTCVCDPLSEPGSRILSIYIDGTLFDTVTIANRPGETLFPATCSSSLYAASDSGAIDDFVLFDRVLTPAEIASLTL
jgi:hypothetical protein